MTPGMLSVKPTASDASSTLAQPSVDEWIVNILRTEGPQTMDQLTKALPATNWAQSFLALDRLSRQGEVRLWPPQHGSYLVSLKS